MPPQPTMSPRPTITRIQDASTADKYLGGLQKLLQHCVNDEPTASSIGFLAPLSAEKASQHWRDLFTASIASGSHGDSSTSLLLVATLPQTEQVIATVQVIQMAKETHTFRGEVRKLLVHPAHRRGGLGLLMMQAAERAARDEMGLEVLVLDTASETAAREFYKRTGWTEWGVCPSYAKFADGRKADCSFFVKMLS